MGEPSSSSNAGHQDGSGETRAPQTTAAFSPRNHNSARQQRSTILLHQKSPLLLATPPQVTRALAYSHAFLIPLNKLVGLLSWTTGDPWESFLMVALFWFAVLYGDMILRFAGPLILVVFLILGMYFRRYSPLSSTGWTGEKKAHKRSGSDAPIEHRKSLDEILATLQAFTGRCNILLAPMMQLTDFLSIQQTATSATTRPALTTLFIRILFASPLWYALTLPPLRLITAKRIVFASGTLVLSWHSRPARISRTILWRSRAVRRLACLLTGLEFSPSNASIPRNSSHPSIQALNATKPGSQPIRFTFALYENQRRWIGLGWTSNMIAYERAPWTDDHLNATPSPDKFQLPEIEGGHAEWRWAQGSKWRLEIPSAPKDNREAKMGEEDAWIYYDNKWLNGTRGQDGWSKYTRRRKWVRDAELVDVTAGAHTLSRTDPDPLRTPAPGNSRDGQPIKRAAPLDLTDAVATTTTKGKTRSNTRTATGADHSAKDTTTTTRSPRLPDSGGTSVGSDAASFMSSPPPDSANSRRSWFGRHRGESDTLSVAGSSSTADGGRTRGERLRRLSPARAAVEEILISKGPRMRGASTGSVTLSGGGSAEQAADVSSVKTKRSSGSGNGSTQSERERRRDEGDNVWTPTERLKEREADWGLGDDASMELG